MLIKNPTQDTILNYKKKIEEKKNEDQKLNSFIKTIPKTIEGTRVKVEANVDNSEEVKLSEKKGIDGIGLFRTEYLFMNKVNVKKQTENAK